MQACEAVGKLFLSRVLSPELRDALNHYTKLASSFPTRSGHHRTLSDSSPFPSRMCSLGFVTIPYSAWEPNTLTSASLYNHSRWIPSPPFSVYWGRAIFSPLVYAHLRRSLFSEAKPCPSFPHWALEFAGSLKIFQASWWILNTHPSNLDHRGRECKIVRTLPSQGPPRWLTFSLWFLPNYMFDFFSLVFQAHTDLKILHDDLSYCIWTRLEVRCHPLNSHCLFPSPLMGRVLQHMIRS